MDLVEGFFNILKNYLEKIWLELPDLKGASTSFIKGGLLGALENSRQCIHRPHPLAWEGEEKTFFFPCTAAEATNFATPPWNQLYNLPAHCVGEI